MSEKLEKLRLFETGGAQEEIAHANHETGSDSPSSRSAESSVDFEAFRDQEQMNTDASLDRKAKVGQWLDEVLKKKKARIQKEGQSPHTLAKYQ
jgi:hypothetical protein